MSKALITESVLTDIANAIRTKDGSTATMKPTEMAAKITAIPTGGGGSEIARKIVERTITEYSDSGVTKVGDYAFQSCATLTSASLSSCENVGYYAFYDCSGLENIDLPKCENINTSAFYNAKKLTGATLPKCTTLGANAFYNCTSLTSVSLPECVTVNNSAFYGCSALAGIDLPECTSLGASAFYGCTALASISLPKCKTIGARAFDGGSGSMPCREITLPAVEKATRLSNAFRDAWFWTITLGVATFDTQLATLYSKTNNPWLRCLNLPNCASVTSATAFANTYLPNLEEIKFSAANEEAIKACDGYDNNFGASEDVCIYFE